MHEIHGHKQCPWLAWISLDWKSSKFPSWLSRLWNLLGKPQQIPSAAAPWHQVVLQIWHRTLGEGDGGRFSDQENSMRTVLGVKFDPSLAVSLGHYIHESHQHFQTYVSARGQLASWGPGPVSKQFYVSKRVTSSSFETYFETKFRNNSRSRHPSPRKTLTA